MSRQIEIDKQGFLSEVDGWDIRCPLKAPSTDEDYPIFCNKNCAWFRIIPYTTGAKISSKIVFCGDKPIGEIKRGDND